MHFKPRTLIRQTTFREFIAEWPPDDVEIGRDLRDRIAHREREIAKKMQTGDELWQWQSGDQEFAMAWGLAIVRNGQVVEEWVEFKS